MEVIHDMGKVSGYNLLQAYSRINVQYISQDNFGLIAPRRKFVIFCVWDSMRVNDLSFVQGRAVKS